MKKISIRMRLTLLSVLLLTVCCTGLTIILNFSANRMADVLEAVPLTPAKEVSEKAEELSFPLIPIDSSKTSQAARNQFQYQSIFYMAVVIVVGGGLTYYLTGTSLKPLQILSSQMKNRTVHNLSDELKVPESADEIADLTISFNQMSKKLDEAFVMQRQFSQNAAHELRTPLAVLKTKVDVFKKKQEHTKEEYDKLLSVLTAHTDRLSELVKELLDLTNMDEISCEEHIELKQLVLDVVKELEPFSIKKKIDILVEGEKTSVLGNRNLLHRVFYNLVENAIKYNIEKGAVKIFVLEEGQQGLVVIEDTGIGIPDEMKSLIFQPFFRVDKSRSRQMGGAGLGLAIVKAIIEKHYGQINVLPNPEGGTIFRVLV